MCVNRADYTFFHDQVAAEKPNPTIFLKACELLGVKPEDAVHVGDDRRNDIWGARDAGCDAWLWGSDVHSFKEVYSHFPQISFIFQVTSCHGGGVYAVSIPSFEGITSDFLSNFFFKFSYVVISL